MGWREKMGGAVAIAKTETLVQKVQNIQKGVGLGGSVPIVSIVPRNENVKSYPRPDTEFARDEREAIIDVDGGPKVRTSFPVSIAMDSPILGGAVDVMLCPDRAEVAGITYSNDELKDLLSRGLAADDLRAVHETKNAFGGGVIPKLVDSRDGEGIEKLEIKNREILKRGVSNYG